MATAAAARRPNGSTRKRIYAIFPPCPAPVGRGSTTFFARAHESAATKALPTWRGEIYLELHRATLTTQSGVKRKHRRAENALVAAETIAGLAHLMGAPTPQNLEPLWRTLLKNEFHDILPGSSIHEVCQGAEAELDSIVAAGLAEQSRALAAIAARLPPGEVGDALVVVNPSLSERPLRAALADGMIASADAIPPLAVRALDRAALTPLPGLEVGERRLENAYLRVELGEDGTIASLFHKPTGREALAGRGNQLWVYPQDKPRAWDAWDIEEDYAERGEELQRAGKPRRRRKHAPIAPACASRAAGAIRASCRRWRSPPTAGASTSKPGSTGAIGARSLRTLTPAAVRAERATFECAFGVVTRPTHANTSWEEAQFEACAHRFVDLSEPGFGLALHQRRQIRPQRARQRAGAEPRARAGLSRPARRRGRAELRLRAHAARRPMA